MNKIEETIKQNPGKSIDLNLAYGQDDFRLYGFSNEFPITPVSEDEVKEYYLSGRVFNCHVYDDLVICLGLKSRADRFCIEFLFLKNRKLIRHSIFNILTFSPLT